MIVEIVNDHIPELFDDNMIEYISKLMCNDIDEDVRKDILSMLSTFEFSTISVHEARFEIDAVSPVVVVRPITSASPPPASEYSIRVVLLNPADEHARINGNNDDGDDLSGSDLRLKGWYLNHRRMREMFGSVLQLSSKYRVLTWMKKN